MTEEIRYIANLQRQEEFDNEFTELKNELKRLEQENKALNFKINQLKANGLYNDLTGIELCAKVVKLEQENKELKVVKEQLKKWNDENLKRQDEMQLWIDLAEEQRKKYRSTLEEIRDYCEKCKKCVETGDEVILYTVIKKVNEVLGNETVS